jgi:hypothetical protein
MTVRLKINDRDMTVPGCGRIASPVYFDDGFVTASDVGLRQYGVYGILAVHRPIFRQKRLGLAVRPFAGSRGCVSGGVAAWAEEMGRVPESPSFSQMRRSDF